MTNEALEPFVSKILAEKYKRKLPPNLFTETPPERERLKKIYRSAFKECIERYKFEDETDEKIAEVIAEWISEGISEETYPPCPDDWD
jgi:predicted amidophosphoribosyltransferase